MSGELFAAVIAASESDDWSRVYELMKQGHLSSAEARQIVKRIRRPQ